MAPDLLAKQRALASLYSADTFLSASSQWASALGEHFQRLQSREVNVLNWNEPEENIACAVEAASEGIHYAGNAAASAEQPVSSEPASPHWVPRFRELLETILSRSQNLHHPRYIGHQVPASLPIAALFDAISSATNQVMAIYEMGPWATAVERAMIQTLGSEIGYTAGTFSGLVTSGGSLANLTALLTARNVALSDDAGGVWKTGVHNASRLALVVQEDVHYCVTRAAGLLGIGTDQIVRIAVDDRRKMCVDALEAALQTLKKDGRTVIAVSAAACATPIGAFDPIDRIADVCERHDVWLHVDAAHGGAMLMSDEHRHLVKGIHRADSVVWDAHKMLFMPALCAFTFYKNREHRFAAFEQDAPYLFDPSNPGIAEYDSGTQTFECTKRAAAYSLWGVWSLFGREIFTDLVDVTMAMTRKLHDKLTEATDFTPLHAPECNIQAFRHTPTSVAGWPEERLGELQLEIRKRLITSGKAYTVPIKLDGIGALRATVINPCTTEADVDAVLDEIRAAARSCLDILNTP